MTAKLAGKPFSFLVTIASPCISAVAASKVSKKGGLRFVSLISRV